MKSLRQLYRIGKGPSSSHTMGPAAAARLFRGENPGADSFRAILYGSLARTGRGHMTDSAILSELGAERTQVVFDTQTPSLPHPNTMDLIAYTNGVQTARMRVLSVGGGTIAIPGRPDVELPEVYEENSFSAIARLCKSKRMRISDYVNSCEGTDIWEWSGRHKARQKCEDKRRDNKYGRIENLNAQSYKNRAD